MYTPDFPSHTLDTLIDQIEQHGLAVIDNAIPCDLTEQLLAECLTQQSLFKPAGIGREADKQLDSSIRSDKTKWFDSQTLVQKQYLSLMEQLRNTINQHFYLGLFDYEAHYATYQVGDFYKKHLDAFRGRSNRVFTTVFYLNSPEGGELVIYKPKSKDVLTTVKPKAGTLVLFVSEEFAHEVLPALGPRHSIAGWFRKNTSSHNYIDPAS